MVQYLDNGGRRLNANDYWKLDPGDHLKSRILRQRLEEKTFAVLKRVNNTRLRALYVRCQRGLMSYEGLSFRELKLYAAQRGIKITVFPKATPTTIKAQLEQADEDATFNRLDDLPPELRLMIFQHYYNSLMSTERPKNREQPPLTLASRITRQESLPLFYNSYDLQLDSGGSALIPYKFRPWHATARLLQCIPTHSLARIKSIQLNFYDLNVGVTLDLRNKDDPVGKISTWLNGHNGFRDPRQQLSRALRSFTISTATREGPFRFQLSDVEEMGEMVSKIIKEPPTQ